MYYSYTYYLSLVFRPYFYKFRVLRQNYYSSNIFQCYHTCRSKNEMEEFREEVEKRKKLKTRRRRGRKTEKKEEDEKRK